MTKKYKLKDSVLVAGEIITDKVKELLWISDDKVEEVNQNIWTVDWMFCWDVDNWGIEQIDVEKIWRIDTALEVYWTYHHELEKKYYKWIFFRTEEDAQRYADRQKAMLKIRKWKMENDDVPTQNPQYITRTTWLYNLPIKENDTINLPWYSSKEMLEKAIDEIWDQYQIYFSK